VSGDEDRSRNQPTECLTHPQAKLRGSLLWWLVWLPVIIVVTLWIAGWGFGNYGGPWSPKPQPVQPQISDPGFASLHLHEPTRSLGGLLINT
jgi:hypothetical protein